MPRSALNALLLACLVTACGKPPAGTNEAAGKDQLAGRIIVDPRRTASPAPGAAAHPRAVGIMTPACRDTYRTGNAWATRLPADVPLYPGARVTEAAGTDAAGCTMRIVSFTSSNPAAAILDHYAALTARSGYASDREGGTGEVVLAGTRGADVYYLTATPQRSGGTSVDLIVNHGR